MEVRYGVKRFSEGGMERRDVRRPGIQGGRYGKQGCREVCRKGGCRQRVRDGGSMNANRERWREG